MSLCGPLIQETSIDLKANRVRPLSSIELRLLRNGHGEIVRNGSEVILCSITGRKASLNRTYNRQRDRLRDT